MLSSLVENRRKATDRVVRGLVTVAFLIAMAPLISTLYTVIIRGIGAVNWNFISTTTKAAFNPKTLAVTTNIGAWQAVVGTLIITGIAALISIPIGILTAIYLVEYSQRPNWMSRAVTFLVDVMTGIPSIVAGLFAFSLFTLIVGPKAFSGFSASIALSVLMIPIVVRSSEEMLKLVSMELREASYALGVSKFAHHHEDRASDRHRGPGHRRDAGDRPGHRRDRADLHRRQLHAQPEPQRVHGRDGDAAGHGVLRVQVSRAPTSRRRSPRPGVRRCCSSSWSSSSTSSRASLPGYSRPRACASAALVSHPNE